MPDITMCKTKDCPKRNNCYRYTANPNCYWQTYSLLYKDCSEHNYRNYIHDYRQLNQGEKHEK